MERTKVRYGTRWLSFLFIVLISCLVVAQSQGAEMVARVYIPSGGTLNYQNEVIVDGIFWEYGAELAQVGDVPKPPFDEAGGQPGGGTYCYARVTDEVARTGNKSVKLYQPPPTKGDADRRVVVREYSTGTQEMYVSWWVYITESMFTQYSWRSLAGLTLRYGNYEDKWKYRTSIGFGVAADGRFTSRVDYLFSSSSSPGQIYDEVYSSYTKDELVNTWTQFELYYKMSNTTEGVLTSWINGEVVRNTIGIVTDPRGDSRWNTESCYWTYYDFPYFNILLYNERTEPECWYYFDDVVISTEQVPQDYGVVGS